MNAQEGTMKGPKKPLRRPPGMGTIYQRGGVWWVRVPGEKPQSARTRDKKEAEDLLAKMVGVQAIGGLVPDRGRASYEELETMFITDLRANGRRSAENVEKYRLPHLRLYFGGMKARDITYDVVNGYVARRLATAARATVSQEVKHLKRMFALAHRAEKVDRVPAFPTVAIGDNARKGFVEPDVMERVIANLPDHARGPARFAYLTGWRIGEVLGLQWKNVDHGAGHVRLDGSQTKSGKPRTFPFAAIPPLVELIREQRAKVSEEERERGAIIPQVFPYNGDDLGSFRGAWRNAVKAAGVPGLTRHDLRRSAARNLRRAGVPEGVIMKLCGWSTRSMFDRYNIVDDRDLIDGVERLSEFLDAKAQAAAVRS